MIKDKYLAQITRKVNQFKRKNNLKFFLFGSSLIKDHFGDVDLGVVGEIQDKEISNLKEEFVDSTLPYFVDIINFNKAPSEFKNNVFNSKVLWIKH